MLKFSFPFIKNWSGYLYYFVVLFETYFNVTVCTVWLVLFYKGSNCNIDSRVSWKECLNEIRYLCQTQLIGEGGASCAI